MIGKGPGQGGLQGGGPHGYIQRGFQSVKRAVMAHIVDGLDLQHKAYREVNICPSRTWE